MSHYTAIKTKYKNLSLLKKSINKLNFPYTLNKNNSIEISFLHTDKNLSSTLYRKDLSNEITFCFSKTNYDIILDFDSWGKKDYLNLFLRKLELNYNYSEVVDQAFQLGFVRTKKVFGSDLSNRFVFQRCVEIKDVNYT